MNELNQLEKHLRSWIPRAPSEKIRRQIFSPATMPPEFSPRDFHFACASLVRAHLRWFAPTAFSILILLFVVSGPSKFFPRPHSFLVASAQPASTNAEKSFWATSTFAFQKNDLNLEWNIWSKATFEWTNRAFSPSSRDSLSFVKTNLLMR